MFYIYIFFLYFDYLHLIKFEAHKKKKSYILFDKIPNM